MITDSYFVIQNCRSLECLHLYLPVTEWKLCHQGIGFSASSGAFPRGCTRSISDRTFCNAVYFKLFPKYEEIFLPLTDDSLLHLVSLIHRKIPTCLEELYLVCYIVIHVRGITATKSEFPWLEKWLCDIYTDVRESVKCLYCLLFSICLGSLCLKL